MLFNKAARHRVPLAVLGLICLHPLASGGESERVSSYREWRTYGGDVGSSHYSALDQINRGNVASLEVAWRFKTGDADPENSQMQCNPIIIGERMYVTSPKLKVFALDAATGKEIWRFDPFSQVDAGQGINRGVAYWQGHAEGESGERILFGAGQYLYALNAATGELITSFGDEGRVDLRVGLGRALDTLQVDITTPGTIFENLIIVGSRTGETPAASPGHVRAYDVITGKLEWVFHTIPQPGEYGYETWPADAWDKVGAANAWSGMSLDHERGIVFVPTGSPSYDFYGGNRTGDNLFGNSLMALEARSGKRIWHFQTVHHDLWDRDVAAPPNLVTVNHNGAPVDAVVQLTKAGFAFIFDRETGAPLYPIEERPVGNSDMPGERVSATQPFPTKPPPFTRQYFGEADVTDLSPESKAHVLEQLETVRYGEPFIPPSVEGSMLFPGTNGGAGWGGGAYDPETGYLYVNATEIPYVITLVDVSSESGDPGRTAYLRNCSVCHGLDRAGVGQDFPSLVGVGQKYSYVSIANIIRYGKGRMPGFPGFKTEDLLLILDYLNLPADAETVAQSAENSGVMTKLDVPYLHNGYRQLLDQDGYPGIKPPWGTLTAIDLNEATIAWQVPLGEYPGLVEKGIRNTGTENFGGPLVTRGDLIFIAATMDEKFRAFDKRNGKVLWETTLPAAAFAIPSTYEAGGRQFIVIAAGGGKSGLKSADEFIAFTLPETD